MKYIFHEDPGHGWLEVRRAELLRLGISKTISRYSYLSADRQRVFLEEDCDAERFILAKRALGETVPFDRVQHDDDRIRNLSPYLA